MEQECKTLTEDGGITKKVVAPGYDEDFPVKGQQVILLFECKLVDGTVVQSSSDPEMPMMFFVDSEAVFKGFDISAMSMHRGEVSYFNLKPAYGYGKEAPEKVPEDAELELRVEMLDFHEKWKYSVDLPEDQRLDFAAQLKATGNDHFKAKRLKAACYYYRQGVEYVSTLVLSDIGKTPGKVLELRKSLYQNLSVVLNALERWHRTVKYCTQLVERESENAKARYLRGVAYYKVGKFDDALADIKVAQKLSPGDAKVLELLKEIRDFRIKWKAEEKKKFQKMFQSESIYKEVAPRITQTLQKFPDYDPTNPKVFMTLQIGSRDPKTLVFELIKTKAPKTVENFRVFCTGEKVSPYHSYHYKDTYFHKLIRKFMVQGGDVERKEGTGGYSIYGSTFEDENFFLPHSQAGILSMANQGPNTNGSQFFITFKKAPWCNGKNVAFGRLIKGFDFLMGELRAVETATEFYIPKLPIRILDCGEYKEDIKEIELPPKKKSKS